MSRLEEIIANGNRGHAPGGPRGTSQVICADGFRLSVIAGGGTYCTPRPTLCGHPHYTDLCGGPDRVLSQVACDYAGPYRAVEVGFPSTRPEPWATWADWAEHPEEPTETVYGYVPVEAVRELVAAHGGERS